MLAFSLLMKSEKGLAHDAFDTFATMLALFMMSLRLMAKVVSY